MKRKIKAIWAWFLVFFGFARWVRPVLCRPKYQNCPYDGSRMKRIKKTGVGARYYCRKCKTGFHLDGGGTRLVPL